MKLDLTNLIDEYPTVKALAFDARGKRLAVGAALYVLIYKVVSASELELLSQFPVNDQDDEDSAEGDAIVDRIAFANDPETLYVSLTTHSGNHGFDAERSFDIDSGERLSCTRRDNPPSRLKLFEAAPEFDEDDVPEDIAQDSAQRLWASDDSDDELWTDESGMLVRWQPEDERATVLRSSDDVPEDGMVVTIVSPDGKLCARACSDFSEGTISLELFRITEAIKASRRLRRTASASANAKLAAKPDPKVRAQEEKFRTLLAAANLPAPQQPAMMLLLAEAALLHGVSGQELARTLLDHWEQGTERELITTWQSQVAALRQRAQENATAGEPAPPRLVAGDAADALYAQAWALAATGQNEAALGQLLELVSTSNAYQKDRARRTMVMLFELMGPANDQAREFRSRLQIYL